MENNAPLLLETMKHFQHLQTIFLKKPTEPKQQTKNLEDLLYSQQPLRP